MNSGHVGWDHAWKSPRTDCPVGPGKLRTHIPTGLAGNSSDFLVAKKAGLRDTTVKGTAERGCRVNLPKDHPSIERG